jgi:CheY-like chemotaxis protein
MLEPEQRPRLLIVDDDADQLFFSQRLMQKAEDGFSIVTAGGGPEAVAYLTDACAGDPCAIPAVIFLDIKMPGMDGFEVLRWLRDKEEFRQVKVIILSSSDDPNDAKKAAELGADGYLIKDPAPAVLGGILREVLAERAAHSDKVSTTHRAV